MWGIWLLWEYYEDQWLTKISKSYVPWTVSEKVIMLFTLDYVYMREYFNRILKNFVEFWEIENHFVIWFYRYLNLCSTSHLRHFLKDISKIDINDIEFKSFMTQVQNYIHSKINLEK